MANRRPNFEIPDVINPTGRRCIQFMIPDDAQHVAIFAGLTRQLLDWQRWERDELKRGTLVAQVWREVWNSVDWSGEDCMGCCPEPTNRRYNENGELEVSYDGGVTWEPSPVDDSRISGAIAPPIAGADGEEKKCIGAASVAGYVKQAFLEDLTEGATYADLNAAAVAVIAALGVTGVGILIAAAAAAIFILGVSATVSAFTAEVWEDFQCILYCYIEDDASFTEAGWQGVKAEVLDTFTGVVSAVLYNWVNSIGSVGLTNSARSGFATEGDCSECECVPPCEDPLRFTLGTVIGSGVDGEGRQYFDVTSGVNPIDGSDTIIWGDMGAFSSVCCTWYTTAITAGSCPGSIGRYVTYTETTEQVPFESPDPAEDVSAFALQQNGCLFGNPFTARITLDTCTE